jgi:hypothetical protein
MWTVPSVSTVNQYGDTFDGKNYCLGLLAEPSNEAFWDIKHHTYQQLLLSVSASGQALLWSTADIATDNEFQDQSGGKLLSSLKLT